MRVLPQYKWAWDDLPEDVHALLLLLDDTYFFVCGSRHKRELSASYYDIVKFLSNKGGNEEYLYQQPIDHSGANKARFIAWVRAGMPGGYGTRDNAFGGDLICG